MKIRDLMVIGIKQHVIAVSRADGQILWSTKLDSGRGGGLVTVLSDDKRVFAHFGGHLHCLEISTGRLLWSNELKGYGYGFVSLSFPDGTSSGDEAIKQQLMAQGAASASSTNASF